ncbi:MAG: hypothetical protein O2820_02825 [Planctomycetota bacterium]|nr:hypothetical protein [Planctomycetota bacterium]MDA1248136.1 hypothetical protein [Planctomycetota bacterium]
MAGRFSEVSGGSTVVAATRVFALALTQDLPVTDYTQTGTPVSQSSLTQNLVDQIQSIIEDAEKETRPLEMEPYRGRLFELFVVADGSGMLDEKLEPNLTSDAIAKILADRWQLRDSAAAAKLAAGNLADENLSRMRLLWSFLRMWMEWTYAWQRWNEFHDDDGK